MTEKISPEFRRRLSGFLRYLNDRSKDFPTEEERGALRKARSQLYIAFPELAPSVIHISESGGGMFGDWEKTDLLWDSGRNNWACDEETVTNNSGMMVPFTSTPFHHKYLINKTHSGTAVIASHYGLTKEQAESFDISKTSPRDLVRIVAGKVEVSKVKEKG